MSTGYTGAAQKKTERASALKRGGLGVMNGRDPALYRAIDASKTQQHQPRGSTHQVDVEALVVVHVLLSSFLF